MRFHIFHVPTSQVTPEQFSRLSDAVETLAYSETYLTRGPKRCILTYLASPLGSTWKHRYTLHRYYGLPTTFQEYLVRVNDMTILKSRRKKKIRYYLRAFLAQATVIMKVARAKDERENAPVAR